MSPSTTSLKRRSDVRRREFLPSLGLGGPVFADYQQPKRAEDHLEKWMRSAMRSRLEPFKKFVRMLRVHLDGILAWTKRAEDHLEKWMRSAMRSRLEPFKKFVRMLRVHLDGILAWTKHRVSNGAVEGMNNKIKSISHRSFGFRTAENFIAAI